MFAELARGDLQLIPVEVEGQREPYFLLNITRVVKCIDDEASDEVRYVTPEHGLPDQLGEYRSVMGMRIDPSKVGDAQVFRTWGWVAIVVSEAIKKALENVSATGTRFKEVTGPSTINAEERTRNQKIRELLETAATAREAALAHPGDAGQGGHHAHRHERRVAGSAAALERHPSRSRADACSSPTGFRTPSSSAWSPPWASVWNSPWRWTQS